MGTIAAQITCLTIVCSIVYSDADQRKYQCSASLAFVRGIHRRPVNSPHKWPVTRKNFPFYDVIMPKHNKTQQSANRVRISTEALYQKRQNKMKLILSRMQVQQSTSVRLYYDYQINKNYISKQTLPWLPSRGLFITVGLL